MHLPTPSTLRREPDLDQIWRFRGLPLRAYQTKRQLGVDLSQAISPQHVTGGRISHQAGDIRVELGLVPHHHPAYNRMIAAGIDMKRLGVTASMIWSDITLMRLNPGMAACLSSWAPRPPVPS